MRPLHLTVVTAVSTAMLLATTSVFAVTPKVNLGLLKAQEAWKVGTVENNGEQYCAMVGTYGKGVVVAFARNPQGLGSLALDFGDPLFTTGKPYDVSLTAEGLETRTFAAKASADRSLVVQIGQDGSFYDALSKNGVLGIDMPAATLRVDLAKFSTSHQDLVECAGTLTPTVSETLPQVREAKTNVDRALEDMGRTKTQTADAGTKTAIESKDSAKRVSSFDEIEAQLEAEARAQVQRSRETIASIEAKQNEVRSQLQEKGVKEPLDLAVLEPAAGGATTTPDLPAPTSATSSTGRKLLAAIGAREPVDMPFSTGAASRDIESRELGLADAKRAAAETAQALELKNQIAALEAQKNAEAQEKLAAFDARQQELTKQTQTLAEKRDQGLASLSAAAASEEKNRAMRANVIAQQAKIASVSEVKQAETAALTKTLATTQTDFASRIAALEAESQALRDQVQAVTAENTRLKQAGTEGKPEDRLEIARLKKQLLDMETQRQGELARADAAQKELEAARQQLAGLRQDGQLEQSRLATLKQQIETERRELETARANGAAANTASMDSLRQSLAKQESELVARENALDKQAEVLAEESQRLSREKTASIDSLRQSLAKQESELVARQNDLDKQAKVLAEESQRLSREKQELTQAKTTTVEEPIQLTAVTDDTGKILSPGQALLTQSQRLVDAERAELDDLRNRIKDMQQDLAKARDEATQATLAKAAMPVPTPVVIQEASAAEKAEMARLKDENLSLRQRLAGFLGGSNPAKPETIAATSVAPISVTEAVKAETKVVEEPKTVISAKEKMPAPAPVAVAPQPTRGSPAMAALGLTADELNATEPAAGAPALTSVVPVPAVSDPTPGNDKRMPAVPAAKVVAETVTAPVVAVTEKTEKTVVTPVQDGSKTVESKTTETTVVADAAAPMLEAPSSEAELELARLAPITAPVPRAAPPVAAAHEQKQDKGIFGIFGRSMGYGAANDRAAQQAAEPKPVAYAPPVAAAPGPIIRVTHAKPTPVPQPVAALPPAGTNGISTADANRAAAFLDNIMAFHRPDGAPAPSTLPAPAPAPQVAAAVVPDTAVLNQIETAAGSPMAAPVSAAPVSAPPVVASAPAVPAAALARPAYLQQKPSQAPSAPARAMPVAAQPLELDALLAAARVGQVQYTGASSENLRQWTTGNLNGLYERQNSVGRFGTQVDDYLARYQDDCPGKLDVRMGAAEKTASGFVQLAELSCNMAGNTYATTIAFLETAGAFHSVLHAGQSTDSNKVRAIGQDLVRVMKGAGDIRVASVPPASRVMPVAAVVPTAPVERPRFRIEIEAPAAPPEGVYELPTTIIE